MRLFTSSAVVVLVATLHGVAIAQSPGNSAREVPVRPIEQNNGPTPDLEEALEALTAAVQQGFTAIGNGLQSGFTAIGNGLTQLGTGMTQGFNALGTALTNLGNGVTAGFTALGNGLQAGFTGLGNALQARKRYGEAVAAYRTALSQRADFPEAHSNLGNALRRLHRVEAAIAHFKTALAHRPDHVDALCGLAAALQGKGDLAAAERTGAQRFDDPAWASERRYDVSHAEHVAQRIRQIIDVADARAVDHADLRVIEVAEVLGEVTGEHRPLRRQRRPRHEVVLFEKLRGVYTPGGDLQRPS